MQIIPFYLHRGGFVGGVTVDENGWHHRPGSDTDGMQAATYPSEEAMTSAIDAWLGPEKMAAMEARRAEIDARNAAYQDWVESRAFTGVNYDAERSTKDTAKALHDALIKARDAGELPWDQYRVNYSRYGMTIRTWYAFDKAVQPKIEAIRDSFARFDGDEYWSAHASIDPPSGCWWGDNEKVAAKRLRDTTPPKRRSKVATR